MGSSTSTVTPARHHRRREILLLLSLILTVAALGFLLQKPGNLPVLLADASTPTVTPTLADPESGSLIDQMGTLPEAAPVEPAAGNNGLLVLALPDGLHTHLFAFHPVDQALTRLTNNPWDDQSPALSPDGTRLAYASRQNGYWDLYVLDLQTRELIRVTDSPEYDGSPSWSPDGQWLAYESYIEDDLEIFIRNLADSNQPLIRLTDNETLDSSPAWSPGGREIAFVSSQAGSQNIWLARLDQVDNRFSNLSPGTGGQQNHPAWSPDGRYLAWSTTQNQTPELVVWDALAPDLSPRPVGSGSWPAWSPDGSGLASIVLSPNQAGIAVYDVATGLLKSPLIDLPGEPSGLAWQDGVLSDLLPSFYLGETPVQTPTMVQVIRTLAPVSPQGRAGIVELDGVDAPYPYLHDEVDEAFFALRSAVGSASGWDFLAGLDSAYLPLTEPSSPGVGEEWLFTGRAFTVNTAPAQAGWMVTAREDFNGQPYWRLYIKARYQDGSQGEPLNTMLWDILARNNGTPLAFEQGGEEVQPPSGYWIDFTDLAQRIGWQRQGSLQNWRTFFPATRYNQFVITGGRDWAGAMAEMYPPEALNIPTSIPTLTLTPTSTFTPRPNVTVTPAPSATFAGTPTFRPTWTPLPGSQQP